MSYYDLYFRPCNFYSAAQYVMDAALLTTHIFVWFTASVQRVIFYLARTTLLLGIRLHDKIVN